MNTDKNFPKTHLEAIRYFTDEENCHNFMVSMRWPDGVRCAHCESEQVGKLVVSRKGVPARVLKSGKVVEAYTLTRRIWNCKACKKQFTAKVGTIFEDSPVGLDKWLPAVWMIVNAKNGVSSCELHRSLGVTQKTAWFMAHRIRMALESGSFNMMGGVVEVDETYIGGLARKMNNAQRKRAGIKGTGGINKTPVMGLLERHSGKGKSRVHAEVIPVANGREMVPRVRKYVLFDSEVHTDQHGGYRKLKEEYDHKVIDHAEAYVKDGVHTNGMENFWSLLKRTIKGTYIHCAPFHLHRYLGEQVYRFNERKDEDQGRFLQAMEGALGKRLTYEKLTGNATV